MELHRAATWTDGLFFSINVFGEWRKANFSSGIPNSRVLKQATLVRTSPWYVADRFEEVVGWEVFHLPTWMEVGYEVH